MPFVSVQVIIVGDAGADAAEEAVPHEQFDGISPDMDQAVAAFVVDSPEASASDLVVAGGEEDDFIAAEDPAVSPVQNGNAELVHPDVTSVPKPLHVPDAEDIDPLSVPMVTSVVVTVPSGRRRGRVMVRAAMPVFVMILVFRSGRCPVRIMARLTRCADNGEEQCDAEYLCFHDVFLLFPLKSNYRTKIYQSPCSGNGTIIEPIIGAHQRRWDYVRYRPDR
jgi:hypothetical protein